ncbi:hypothetical protein JTF19_15215 [Enterobacteriaceae bacterium RIT814]|nr:hypothetical protein [Enterobacteriaceae bacterium RIT 814]
MAVSFVITIQNSIAVQIGAKNAIQILF